MKSSISLGEEPHPAIIVSTLTKSQTISRSISNLLLQIEKHRIVYSNNFCSFKQACQLQYSFTFLIASPQLLFSLFSLSFWTIEIPHPQLRTFFRKKCIISSHIWGGRIWTRPYIIFSGKNFRRTKILSLWKNITSGVGKEILSSENFAGKEILSSENFVRMFSSAITPKKPYIGRKLLFWYEA